jgi:hypothetical protein
MTYQSHVIDQYPNVRFYFVAITNDSSLIRKRLIETDYHRDTYMANPNVDTNINQRMETFSTEFTKILAQKESNFIVYGFNRAANTHYFGRDLKIKKRLIRKMLK